MKPHVYVDAGHIASLVEQRTDSLNAECVRLAESALRRVADSPLLMRFGTTDIVRGSWHARVDSYGDDALKARGSREFYTELRQEKGERIAVAALPADDSYVLIHTDEAFSYVIGIVRSPHAVEANEPQVFDEGTSSSGDVVDLADEWLTDHAEGFEHLKVAATTTPLGDEGSLFSFQAADRLARVMVFHDGRVEWSGASADLGDGGPASEGSASVNAQTVEDLYYLLSMSAHFAAGRMGDR